MVAFKWHARPSIVGSSGIGAIECGGITNQRGTSNKRSLDSADVDTLIRTPLSIPTPVFYTRSIRSRSMPTISPLKRIACLYHSTILWLLGCVASFCVRAERGDKNIYFPPPQVRTTLPKPPSATNTGSPHPTHTRKKCSGRTLRQGYLRRNHMGEAGSLR